MPAHSSSCDRRRRAFVSNCGVAIGMAGWLLVPVLRAAEIDDSVHSLQREWELIRYQAPAAEREKRYEVLAARARKVSDSNPGRAEPLIWEGIIVSSWAGEKGGLGALGLVKQARDLYEQAIRIDGHALDGSAYNSLGVLYYKVPGWPLGFGDKARAKELLEKSLSINPKGIDPNFFYADYLVETKQPDQAIVFLERALNAPARPGRHVADAGRRDEARALLAKVQARN
jgi:tetratricopeptide (TPR) repeat protein